MFSRRSFKSSHKLSLAVPEGPAEVVLDVIEEPEGVSDRGVSLADNAGRSGSRLDGRGLLTLMEL